MITQGLIIRSTGSWYKVRAEDGTVLDCRIQGKFRLEGVPLTNPVAVGDIVSISPDTSDETYSITKILPRKNYVARQSPRKKHQLHLLASNVDQALLIITLVQPKLKQGFIDRFLLMTEPRDIPVIIAFNKCDLYTENDLRVYDFLKEIYTDLGYKVILSSATEGLHIEPLRELLRDKVTLISGQSGVGKSSLVNAIDSTLDLSTKKLSNYTGKGQHTTTFAEMYHLTKGGSIIDTPGIKTLSFNNLEPQDIAHNFRELFIASDQCKYNNCLHRTEPGCEVVRLVESGKISELRYGNYLTLLEEAEDQNYWERKSDY